MNKLKLVYQFTHAKKKKKRNRKTSLLLLSLITQPRQPITKILKNWKILLKKLGEIQNKDGPMFLPSVGPQKLFFLIKKKKVNNLLQICTSFSIGSLSPHFQYRIYLIVKAFLFLYEKVIIPDHSPPVHFTLVFLFTQKPGAAHR